MNKLLALTFLALVLVAAAGAESRETEEEGTSEARDIRAADKKEAKKPEKSGAKKAEKNVGKKEGKKAGKKDGKKAGNKGGKKAGKKGGKKAGKKGGKKAGKKGGKKAGKSVKKVGKKAGKKQGSRQSTGCLATSCLDTAAAYLSLLLTKGTTLTGQFNRITRFNTSSSSKGRKQNNFNGVFGLLVDSAGGNASAPKCGQATTGAGANEVANVTKGLAECPAAIAAACILPAIPASVNNCSTTVARFSAGVNKCLNLTVNPTGDGAATCTCWADPALASDVPTIRACNILPQVLSVQNATTACTAAVLACNRLQARVSSVMQACKQNPGALTSKLKSLTANLDDATKVAAKIATLTGGASGFKVKRAPATTCSGVAEDAREYAEALNSNPAATNLPPLAADVTGAGAVTCSDADKAKLTSAASSVNVGKANAEKQIEATQQSLAVLTGTTASAAAIAAAPSCSNANCNPSAELAAAATTPSSAATNAIAGRRRRRVVEDILRAKLM